MLFPLTSPIVPGRRNTMANNLGVLDGCVVAKKSLQECHPVASIERREGDFPPAWGTVQWHVNIYLKDLTQWSRSYFPLTPLNSFLFLPSFSNSSINYYKALQDSVFAFCQWRKTSMGQIPICPQDFIHRQPFKWPCNIFICRVLY